MNHYQRWIFADRCWVSVVSATGSIRHQRQQSPFSCDCKARYLIAKQAVNSAFDDGEAEDGGTDRRRKAETKLLSELYVILGALDAPATVLERVLAAIDGEDLPHPTLTPFERDQ